MCVNIYSFSMFYQNGNNFKNTYIYVNENIYIIDIFSQINLFQNLTIHIIYSHLKDKRLGYI